MPLPMADIKEIKPVLIKLASFLEDNDSDALDLVETLKHMIGSENYKNLLKIQTLINDLDFEIAQEKLSDLCNKISIVL